MLYPIIICRHLRVRPRKHKRGDIPSEKVIYRSKPIVLNTRTLPKSALRPELKDSLLINRNKKFLIYQRHKDEVAIITAPLMKASSICEVPKNVCVAQISGVPYGFCTDTTKEAGGWFSDEI